MAVTCLTAHLNIRWIFWYTWLIIVHIFMTLYAAFNIKSTNIQHTLLILKDIVTKSVAIMYHGSVELPIHSTLAFMLWKKEISISDSTFDCAINSKFYQNMILKHSRVVDSDSVQFTDCTFFFFSQPELSVSLYACQLCDVCPLQMLDLMRHDFE